MKRALGICGIISVIAIIALGIAAHVWLPRFRDYFTYGYADLPSFMERRTTTFDGHPASFLISKFSPNAISWSLVNDHSSPKSVENWRKDLNADFVINGAYFDEKNEPTGFYQSSTAPSITPWPSVADPAGYTFDVEIVDGRMNLRYLPEFNLPGSGVGRISSGPLGHGVSHFHQAT